MMRYARLGGCSRSGGPGCADGSPRRCLAPPPHRLGVVQAVYDPRLRFGPYGRRFRPNSSNSGGLEGSSNSRDAHAARLREARQDILRKRDEAETVQRQEVEEQEELMRNPLEPGEVVQRCLVLLRKGDTAGLLDLCREDTLTGVQEPVYVGSQAVTESGPLASCSGLMDVTARRVLPGHLLRRCQVLSAFRPSHLAYQTRTAVTGCTGEEGVLCWQLARDRYGVWRVQSIAADGGGHVETAADVELLQPHPRLSPEAVVAAQLVALRAGDVSTAGRFLARCGGPNWLRSDAARGLLTLLSARGAEAVLEGGALPTQRRHLQAVRVRSGSPSEPDVCLVWSLSVQANGC